MKLTFEKDHASEAAVYFLMALLASGTLFWLHSFRPEIYVQFVTEDYWGEYGTFVYFALGGVLLLFFSRRQTLAPSRYFWALAGIFVLFIAAEEISWGQRMLHLPIPSALRQLNSQGELNLHNVGYLDTLNRSGMHRGAGLLILGWSLGSALIWLLAPARAKKMEESTLPLIPTRLLPLFLLVPLLFLGKPLILASEIGELFLGMATAAWALHLLLKNGRDKDHQKKNRVGLILGFFGLGAAMTVALTLVFPGSLKMRLNQAAQYFYPARGMYDQADRLFEYIYDNPRYLLPETRIHHGRMLIEWGYEERGFQVLTSELEHLDGPEVGEDEGDFLRRRGTIRKLLAQSEEAEKDFRQAIEIEEAHLKSIIDPDLKAERLWSVARTLAALGQFPEAFEKARQARETAVSERLRGKVDRWILSQKRPSAEEEASGSKSLSLEPRKTGDGPKPL